MSGEPLRQGDLKDFNVEKVAPNFLKFLQEQGKVTFVNKKQRIEPYKDEKTRMLTLPKGVLSKEVFLDGKLIGVLTFGLRLNKRPARISFEGKLPNVPPERVVRGELPHGRHTETDEGGVVWTHLSVGDQWNADGTLQGHVAWKEVPFP